MTKKQYRFTGESKWCGLSGNVILGLYCVPGSGKKVVVQSVEIYNKNQLGMQTGTVDANAAAPTRISIGYCSSLTGGETVVVSKFNDAAGNWPSSVQVKQRATYVPTMINWYGSTTYNDATVAVGDVTFTPTAAPSPAWVINEHRDAGRYFIGTSGNVGTYYITANTATALTLDPPLLSPVSTTGFIAEPAKILSHGILKMATPSIAGLPVGSNGYVNQNFYGGAGQIFGRGNSIDQQDIFILAGQKLAIFVDNNINSSLPMFIEATFIIEGTPNRTYQSSFYTYLDAHNESIMSIDNNVGSGRVVRLVSLSVSEVGTLDSPYFQLVPIGSIDPASFSDLDKQLTAFPNNSADGALSSSQVQLFTNVPAIPSGAPVSYIAEGAPIAASPRGFNYLNAKDFIGPVYATFFPEAAAYKVPNAAFWTAGPPGTMGSHLSQAYSTIKGYRGAPLIIREGEALGIVSGAETATLTTAIGISGFGAYEFSLTFYVESAYVPTVTLIAQLIDGTPVENAQVMIAASSGGALPFKVAVTIVNSATTATVTHTAHGLVTGDKVVIKGASLFANNGIFTITRLSDNSYVYTMPNAPGSSPTGSITSTFVALSGLTNAAGKISMSREFASIQPVVGWTRKSSSVPYYKTAPIAGIISNSSDSSFSALLISDE